MALVFRKGVARCGWKGISIALIIHSLDRTYRMGTTENLANTRRTPLNLISMG